MNLFKALIEEFLAFILLLTPKMQNGLRFGRRYGFRNVIPTYAGTASNLYRTVWWRSIVKAV